MKKNSRNLLRTSDSIVYVDTPITDNSEDIKVEQMSKLIRDKITNIKSNQFISYFSLVYFIHITK
jgi:hypothetical protein